MKKQSDERPAVQNQYFGDKPKNFDWYLKLKKAPLNPPSWVFPVVWPILYALIGISGFKYLKATNFEVTKGAMVYGGQLLLNFIWSPLFFRFKKVGWAFIDIVAMLGMIGWNVYQFNKVQPTSAKLLLPYLAWVTFATYLNGYIYFKNRKKQ